MSVDHEPASLPEFPDVNTVDLSPVASGILGFVALEIAQGKNKSSTPNPAVAAEPTDRGTVSGSRSEMDELLSLGLHDALNDARKRVAKLSNAHRAAYNLNTTLQASGGRALDTVADNWAGWIVESASDDELLGFLSWNAERLAKKQAADWYVEGVGQIKRDYAAGLKKGLAIGAVHPETEEAFTTLDDVPVLMSDYTDTLALNRAGYVRLSRDAAHIAEVNYDFIFPDVAETIRHELGHAWLGKLDGIWRDELVTEHIAHATVDQAWQALSPLDHPLRGSYQSCRYVGEAAWRDVPTEYITRYYSARSPEARLEAAWELACKTPSAARHTLSAIDAIQAEVERIAPRSKRSAWSAAEAACKEMLVFEEPAQLNSHITSGNRRQRSAFQAKLLTKIFN